MPTTTERNRGTAFSQAEYRPSQIPLSTNQRKEVLRAIWDFLNTKPADKDVSNAGRIHVGIESTGAIEKGDWEILKVYLIKGGNVKIVEEIEQLLK
jgi:hypothetical protein